jgi:hypothetical protein
MHIVGKIFLVLNLGLAGTFITFAGTYLQRADHYRTKYENEKVAHKKAVDELNTEVNGLKSAKADLLRMNDNLVSARNREKELYDAQQAKNVALADQLKQIQASCVETASEMTKAKTAIEAATKMANSARDSQIQAEKVKDAAVAAENKAKNELNDANARIRNMGKDIADKAGLIAARDKTIQEDKVLLDIVNRRYPGIFETIHPLATGSVHRVGAGGDLVTIALDSGAKNIASGARFAIYNAAAGYKGEATVREITEDGKFAFTRLTLKAGAKIEVGDKASTNLSRSTAGN